MAADLFHQQQLRSRPVELFDIINEARLPAKPHYPNVLACRHRRGQSRKAKVKYSPPQAIVVDLDHLTSQMTS